MNSNKSRQTWSPETSEWRMLCPESLIPRNLNHFQNNLTLEIIKRWNREDEKISRWVDFALSAVSPTKRRRRIIDLREYFNSLSTHWDEFLKTKQIGLHIDFDSDEKLQYLLMRLT